MSLTIQIPYEPHPGQREFHESNVRFRILACGRRWGKTISGANETIVKVTEARPDAVAFCVAPTYWHNSKQWREILRYCPRQIIARTDAGKLAINRAERYIQLIGNRRIWFRSADNPDSLRSEGLDFLWVDEGGQMKETAWTLALRPALMDRKGAGIFTGTPKGKNWLFRLYTRGQDPHQPDYESWNFSSQNNPYLDPNEIAAFARDMPRLAYQQEILGLFIEDIGSVFRNVDNHVQGRLSPPTADQRYVMGADLAKHQDFTVLIVMSLAGHVVAFDRFSGSDWVLQRKRIVALSQQYGARVLLDSTGVGDPVLDELQRHRITVEGYKIKTSARKKDLIENLVIMLDNGQITYPEIPDLINELKLFGYTTGPTGITKYGAPEGYHDDCVIALAFAAWLVRRPIEARPLAPVEWSPDRPLERKPDKDEPQQAFKGYY